jgi:hypothetical protein
MTKAEAQQRKSELEAELKTVQEIIDSKPTPGERFMQLVDGLEILPKKKQWPNYLFFAKNGEIWFELNQKNNNLWCRYETVWRVFETEFGINYNEIQIIIQEQVEQAYGLKGITPLYEVAAGVLMVEQVYGLKGATPS